MLKFTRNRICPDCGSTMERINRKKWHKLVSRIKPLIHVSCCNRKYLMPEAVALRQSPELVAEMDDEKSLSSTVTHKFKSGH